MWTPRLLWTLHSPIPTWGVTQRAHAALSHWTPKGWVVNLGAGYNASWSKLANDNSAHLASTAVTLGPLGQELGEANESQDKKIAKNKVSITDQKVTVNADGSIDIPAVITTKQSGKFSVMPSIYEGFQIHALGGFGTQYEITPAK